MRHSLRHLSWVFSIALHLAVLIGGAYVSTGPHVKINLNKRMYEVNLVGPPHKGKPGARSAPRQAVTPETAPQKAAPKETPAAKIPEEPKKPEKKAIPTETAKALPKAVNATVAEAKPEEPKKEARKKDAPKKEEPKKEEPKKVVKKAPTKEEILAQALGEATKVAKQTKPGSEGAAKGSGASKNALADALADVGREVSGRGTSGDGTAEDGEGEGESTGSLEDFYATQVIKAIRQNWRFPRLSNAVLATTVELRVNKGGEILASRMVNGSGRSDFDASVMRAVEDTKALPPLPETLPTTFMITFYNPENQ